MKITSFSQIVAATLVLTAGGFTAGDSHAAEPAIAIADIKHEGEVDFEKEVLPLLRKKCLACHNTTEAESDLVLETPQAILKGGNEGAAVVAGKSAESLLLTLASHAKEPIMPPKGNDVGAQALTPDELGLIKLWIDQGAKGEVLGANAPIAWQSLPPGVHPIYAVAMSNNGQYAAAGRANQVFLYHVPSRRELGRLTDPNLLKSGIYTKPGVADLDLIQSLAFSPDNEMLATGGYRTLKIWRRPKNVHKADLAGLAAAGTSVATSSDGKWIAVGDDAGKIQLFDNATGQLAKALVGHTAAVTALEFTADGSQLFSASKDKSVRIWNPTEGTGLARIDTPAEITALQLIDKGAQFATGGADNVVRMWNSPVAPTEALAKLQLSSNIFSIAPDRKYGAATTPDGKIAIIDLSTGGKAGELAGHAGGTSYVAFNAASNRLVSVGADKKVNVWDVVASKLIASAALEAGTPVVAAVNAAGNQLVIGADDGLLQTWKIEGETATVDQAKVGDHAKRITSLLFANDGSVFWTASEDGTVRRFASAGQQQFSANHGAAVKAIAVSVDQQTLASGGDDKQLKIWNAGNGSPGARPTLAGFTGAPQSIVFTPDNLRVIAADAGANQVLVFDVMQGTLEQGHADLPAPATSLAIMPQGEKTLFVVTGANNVSAMWPLAAGRKLAGHNAAITGLAVVAENQLASSSADGAIKIWDTNSGNAVKDLNHGAPVTGIVARADGQRLVSAGANNVAKLWNLQNNQMLAELKGDLNAKLKVEDLQRSLALAKRIIDINKKDLEEANKRKMQEEENAKKAMETVKTTQDEFNKKTEAAKQPIADKEAADKALAEATAAKPIAEEAKKKADEAAKVAAEALTKAQQEKDKATQAANEAANVAKQAADKLTAAKNAAAADAANTGLADAAKAAETAAADAEAKNKAAADAKTAAEKVFADADTAKKAADTAKQQADQNFNNANTAFNQADQKVKQVAQPYQKAVDEKNAAMRNFEAAQRSVERSAVAVKTATEAIPVVDATVKQAEAKSKEVEDAVAAATTAATATEKPFKAIALSPDGKTVATAGDGMTVFTWDTETGVAIDAFAGHTAAIAALAFTADGNVVSAADKAAIVWNTNGEWSLERTIGTPDATSPIADRVTAIDFSPDGQFVATGSGEPSRSGELKIWKVADGSLFKELKEPHSDTIYDVEFSPNGQYVATCGADRFMKVFDIAAGKLHRSYEGHTHHVLGVTWRSDGRMLASCGADNVVKVWNFITGDQTRTIQGFGKEVTAITFAGDGDAVVASSGDKTVRMKNAENGGDMRNYSGATDFLYSVASSGDGKTIIAGGADGVVLVWNDQGQQIAAFAPPKVEDKSASK